MVDEKYMHRCLELAEKGLGHVSPNPMVGAVLVHNDRVIGEGYHAFWGGPHAEVNCLASVTDNDRQYIGDSTLYVNLEPCSHHGKTPPCVDLILAHQIKKVVIGNEDPNPLVAGRGIQILRDASVEVVTDVLSSVCQYFNRRFFTFHQQHRPFLLLKWAQSKEGNFCPIDKSKFWLSTAATKKIVHTWRCEEDAILIGTGTALADNPSLTVREVSGRNPIRILIDKDLKVPATAAIFDEAAKTLVYNLVENKESQYQQYIQLPDQDFLPALLQSLYLQHIQSVIIEGGLATLQAFLEAGLWDEARVIFTPTILSNGLKAPVIPAIPFKRISIDDTDMIHYYTNPTTR
jgi:diaminohydroxyphosphoribosylaminopyrimidine deaminase/5-amino-6-(5-phosphoribosylamino)uracil reductase